jgi:UDP-N-acetylglucosamine 3-dehydrogenase
MEKLRVAVIGAGKFGMRHAHIYNESPITELRAVVRRDEKRAKDAAEKVGVNWYTDVTELLLKEPLDAVSIASGPKEHAESAILCANAGKHIFLEKPMSETLEDADAIIHATEKAGVKLMINSTVRFDPRYAYVFEAIQRGDIGKPVTLSARRVGLMQRAIESAAWNDLILGTTIHEIDIMTWYVSSQVEYVYAEAERKYTADSNLEDAVFSILRFESGAIGCIENSWLLPETNPRWIDTRMDIVGTSGGIHIDGNQGLDLVNKNRFEMPDILNWPVIRGEAVGNLREAVTYFIRCILDDKNPVPGGVESREALAVALALKHSCSTGQIIRMDNFR